jgi:N-acetylglucosaminyldiphosphoundecaprenol N-acetyl-beta-D-mannosaminyltransferase
MYFCNVHMLMLSREDAVLASAMNSADFVFADGVPVAWLQRRMGDKEADVLRGEVAMELLCREAVSAGLAIGLFGSTQDVLRRLSDNLSESFPGLDVKFVLAPGKLDEDSPVDMDWVQQINASGVNALMIGLGCPKQEKWIALYAPHLNCSLLAVGAAFDWLSGNRAQPPYWMERLGLAWLFRLLQNPSKMFSRYMIYNSKFIYHVFRLLLGIKPV